MHNIRVGTDDGYDIKIENGLINKAGYLIRPFLKSNGKTVIISDSNVSGLYMDELAKALTEAEIENRNIIFEAGEDYKNISTLSYLLEKMAEKGINRNDTVIALGGGVTGDIAGFAAGCFMRGIGLIQFPTTLLSAVDSSVGGKTAVNLGCGKNLAGLFYRPDLVICDTGLLRTLPEEEKKCGMAEAVKTGILAGGRLFDIIRSGEAVDMPEELIYGCASYKAGVVMRDEKENGERKLLNLGHTIGHAIEKLSGYTVKHGFAVAAGMAITSRASAFLGMSDRGTARSIEKVLRKYGLPVNTVFGSEELAEAAMTDKKRTGSSITFAIPERIGGCVLRNIETKDIKDFIDRGKEELL